eukprot:gnl/Hemi2/748_TR275_c0_g2_i1.p2 gnl/Hemi2/748_TR275_c0_g2~~gnl/Hemi2/748_TR275_c0_g2_i1.p2  ORF type:complete len:158 (-),score=49.78 gnl/Hemi2/748_TR275_c0_g2_i1:3-476(-)
MTENADRKRKLDDGPVPAVKRAATGAATPTAPPPTPKPDNILAVQNQRQQAMISSQKAELEDNAKKIEALNSKLRDHEAVVGLVNSQWRKLDDDISLLLLRLEGTVHPRVASAATDAASPTATLLARLLQSTFPDDTGASRPAPTARSFTPGPCTLR